MVYGLVILSGCVGEVIVGNVLIILYFNCGCFDFVKLVFDEMIERNVVIWIVVIFGFV